MGLRYAELKNSGFYFWARTLTMNYRFTRKERVRGKIIK